MALAQTGLPEECNMVVEWILDPDLPFDSVDKIKHCACVLFSKEFIPAGSKLVWNYPMVHHKSPRVLQAKQGYLQTPPRKIRIRDVPVPQQVFKVPVAAVAPVILFDPLCQCGGATKCLHGKCWGYNQKGNTNTQYNCYFLTLAS
jgi:hypothetical protein